MKYFLDTEFIEGFRKPLFGEKRWAIDLISIGIVCEDGREYYAISTDFNPKHANDWVKRNVLSKLPRRFVGFHGSSPNERQQALLWKSNEEIKADLCDLFRCQYEDGMLVAPSGIEIYGYYSDYDWVLFASLFGTMKDLPKGFPMYCKDLKQTLDEKADLVAIGKSTPDESEFLQKEYKRVGGIFSTVSPKRTFNEALDLIKKR